MTSDEMIESIKKFRQEHFDKIDGVVVDFSIMPLLRSYPEQLDDFIDKFVTMQLEDMGLEEGESREETHQALAVQFKELFNR